MTLVMIAIGSVLAGAWSMWAAQPRITPDGEYYLRAARGGGAPSRYCWRWGLPWLLGPHEGRWMAVSIASLVIVPVLLAALLMAYGLPPHRVAFGAALLIGLPLWHFGFAAPILTDQAALALGLGSALAAVTGYPVAAVGIALAGATVHETVPVWAAITAWSLWPLIGLGAVLAAALLIRPGAIPVETGQRRMWVIQHPFLAARANRIGKGWDFWSLIAPWGAVAALVPLAPMTWQLGTALALGYGQLLGGTDCARFYQRAAPVAILAAATVAPEGWLLPIAVAHLFNPWRGDGI